MSTSPFITNTNWLISLAHARRSRLKSLNKGVLEARSLGDLPMHVVQRSDILGQPVQVVAKSPQPLQYGSPPNSVCPYTMNVATSTRTSNNASTRCRIDPPPPPPLLLIPSVVFLVYHRSEKKPCVFAPRSPWHTHPRRWRRYICCSKAAAHFCPIGSSSLLRLGGLSSAVLFILPCRARSQPPIPPRPCYCSCRSCPSQALSTIYHERYPRPTC